MNRLGFLTLSVLYANGAVGMASAMTAREVVAAENLPYKCDTVFRKAVELEAAGYVSAGHKDGRARTFYITEKGRKVLKDDK